MPALTAIGIFGLAAAPAGAVTPVDAASSGAGVSEGRLFRIITPGDDALVRGERTPVKLALRKNVSLRNAHLNGKKVKRFFSSRRSGRRQVATLRKSKLKKLLPLGRNFLRFVVRRGGRGGKKDFETVAFTRVHTTPNLIRRFKVGYDPSRGARVSFLASTPIARIRVRLNGRNVSKQFRDGTPLERAVLLGASEGVKHGTNRLLVRAHTHHGEFVKLKRSFKVGVRPTIAGAGPDRLVLAGQTASLNGKASRKALKRSGKPRRGSLRYRWKLTRRPKGSKAQLVGRNRRSPEIRTDLPGNYVAKLSTSYRAPKGSAGSARRRTTSGDVVRLGADAQPRAAVSTFAEVGGKSGISVDVTRECEGAVASTKPPCFYPNSGSDEDLQVVILDRQTLAPVDPSDKKNNPAGYKPNTTYKLTDLSGFAADMKKFETARTGECPVYDSSKLVLLAMRSDPYSGVFDLDEFSKGISIFYVLPTDAKPAGPSNMAGCPQENSGSPRGPFSVIGVPGTLKKRVSSYDSRAWTNESLEVQGPDGTFGEKGSLDGFLKRTADDPARSASTRAFTFPTSIAYDTRRTNGEGKTEFVVGSAAVPLLSESQPPDANGLSVFSFDPVNPEASLKREAFIGQSGGATTGLAWSQLDAMLPHPGPDEPRKPRIGIGIVSNGQIGGYASEPEANSFESVLQTLEATYGVNSDTLARAVNQKDAKGTYSMISVPSSDDYGGIAYQSSSAMAAGIPDKPGAPASRLPVNEGRLTGTLQRGPDLWVYPSDGDPTATEQGAGILPIVYGKQVEWQLTPKPEAATASCQELAFAYIAFAAFNYGTKPWKEGSSSAACEGRKTPPVTAGPRRADTLDADVCSTTDPAATGATGAGVRSTSMELRGAYQSLSTDLEPSAVLSLDPPKDAPFTDDDFKCASNQMFDELVARNQVTKFMDYLQKPAQGSQGSTVIDLGQIAENIKTGTLAKLTRQIKAQDASTPSFWANFAFGATNAIGTIGAFFAPEATALKGAFQFMGVASKSGQSIFSALNGPPGNPVLLTDEYLLLASQLDQQAVEIEVQIQQVLSAQQNGVLQTEGIILSDPHMLAEINARAKNKGEWWVTPDVQQAAQDAYRYRVIQLAYQEFWPQIFSAFRVRYQSACQGTAPRGPLMCFEPTKSTRAPAGRIGDWRYTSPIHILNPQSLTSASQVLCASFQSSTARSARHYAEADPGTPVGLGNGNEYHPQVGVVTKGDSPPYQVYVMAETGKPTSTVDPSLVAPFFRQPKKPDPNAAGFYAPLFWEQNLAHRYGVQCQDADTPGIGVDIDNFVQTLSGRSAFGVSDFFYSNIKPTEIWPTPPK